MKKHKIVILDGNCANPGDLSWEEFEKLGEVTVYPYTADGDVVERAKGADIVIDNKVNITAETIDALPDLKYIGLLSTGYNVVDLDAAKKRGIPVCNVPAYSTMSVAQHAVMLMTALAARLFAHADAVKNGEWGRSYRALRQDAGHNRLREHRQSSGKDCARHGNESHSM